jgi:peptidoglycan/LPS O-acetylase OafA/YrhL
VSRVLAALPFLSSLGKYSYAFYLWHFFVLLVAVQVVKSGPPTFAGDLSEGLLCAGLVLAGAAVAFAISALSWVVLEAPALRLKNRVPYG